MIYDVAMMVEETSAYQDPDDCGEFSVFDGIVVGGGVVRGDYGRIIYEQTQDFQHIDLMTQDMNGTTGHFENIVGLAPGLDAVDVTDRDEKERESFTNL